MFFSLLWHAFNWLWGQTAILYSTRILSTFQAAVNLQYVALFINPELRYIVCVLVLAARLFLLNHSYVSLWYYEMGFLPMLKETADVSVPLWYEKFNLKGWEKEWCTAYFHSLTLRDMRMMFYCVEEMMPIVLRRNSFIIQFNFF